MSALAELPVRQLPTDLHSGAVNMALDAVAADRAADDGIASVRVYGWNPSTLSLGYAQDPDTIDWTYCEEHGIHVTRRPTGGGAIYHDRVGDISYSIVAPSEPLPDNLMDSYRLLCEPILRAFERMGVSVGFTASESASIYQPACYLRELHPSHDLVVPHESTGRKISGNAQYRRRSAVVQHGSLTFRRSPERHVRCFTNPDLDSDTFEQRVTSIENHTDITRERAITILETELQEWTDAESGTFTASERDHAHDLVEDKFGATEWVRDRTDPRSEAA